MPVAAPITKLEAVNRMLHDLGDRPVNTLSGATRIDVVRAINSLDQTLNQFLVSGWWFNKEKIRLTVDGDGFYNIPDNVGHVEAISGGPNSGTEGAPRLVVRGQKLYDAVNATDVFVGEASVLLRIHRLLVYEDCPASVREYVYAAASVRNQSRTLGSQNVDADLKLQARVTFAIIHEEDIDMMNTDVTFSRHFVDMMHHR